MTVVQLTSRNVKRLTAVSIKPDGSGVVIGGENEQGKSSVLDSIMYALAGGKKIPDDAVRHGAKKGEITLDLGELQVKRTITKKGSTLTVTNKDGEKVSSPQQILDDLLGKISLDPSEFDQMDKKKRAELLRQVGGLDFEEIDEEIDELAETRKDAGKEVKRIEGHLASLPPSNDAGTELVDADDLISAISDAQELTNERDRLDEKVDSLNDRLDDLKKQLAHIQANIDATEQDLNTVREERANMDDPPDVAKLQEKLAKVSETNKKVQVNLERKKYDDELLKAKNAHEEAEAKLEEARERKQKMLDDAKFPVPGLSVDGDTVFVNDVPYEQCSQAQRLKVGMAIALSLQPTIRVILLREGSFLDKSNLQLVIDMAKKHGAQVWIERVGDGKECSVIIEDGHVKG